jgi:hypothetical protein
VIHLHDADSYRRLETVEPLSMPWAMARSVKMEGKAALAGLVDALVLPTSGVSFTRQIYLCR